MAKPAPTAESAGIHSLPEASAACAAAGARSAAAAAVLAIGEVTGAATRGTGTKALKRAKQDSSTPAESTMERGAAIAFQVILARPTAGAAQEMAA